MITDISISHYTTPSTCCYPGSREVRQFLEFVFSTVNMCFCVYFCCICDLSFSYPTPQLIVFCFSFHTSNYTDIHPPVLTHTSSCLFLLSYLTYCICLLFISFIFIPFPTNADQSQINIFIVIIQYDFLFSYSTSAIFSIIHYVD